MHPGTQWFSKVVRPFYIHIVNLNDIIPGQPECHHPSCSEKYVCTIISPWITVLSCVPLWNPYYLFYDLFIASAPVLFLSVGLSACWTQVLCPICTGQIFSVCWLWHWRSINYEFWFIVFMPFRENLVYSKISTWLHMISSRSNIDLSCACLGLQSVRYCLWVV